MVEATNFQQVQDRAYVQHGTSEFVGFGTIEVVVARGRTGRMSYLQYRLKGKRISEKEAERLIEKSYVDDAALRRKLHGSK